MNPAHDRINLTRLVARIQRDVDDRSSNDWLVAPETLKQTALHATAVSRKIAYARELLTNVESDELNEPQSSSRQRANSDVAITLDKLEHSVQDVQHRLALLRASTTPRPSVLSTLPLPTEPAPVAPVSTPGVHAPNLATLIPGATSPLDPELPTPTPHDEPLTLFPSSFKPAPKKDASANLLPGEPPAFLATSLQTQEALSSQLADMAVQLRRNAEHFGTALEKDKGVVELVQEKLEQNLGSMVANRGNLKTVAAKSGGTTWLVFISVMVVTIAWVMMMLLIRLTR